MPKFQPDAYAQAAEDLPGYLFAAPLQRPAPKGSRQALDRLASSRQAAAAAERIKERAATAHDRRRLCCRLLAALRGAVAASRQQACLAAQLPPQVGWQRVSEVAFSFISDCRWGDRGQQPWPLLPVVCAQMLNMW